MRRVNMAVIGAGIWGENHAVALSTYPIVDLKLICDLDAGKAKTLADKVGCDWTTEIDDIAGGDIEAVGIATPDHAHTAPCLAMIEAGKHVLVEKPLTTDVGEARRIVDAAQDRGVKLMVDFQLRWDPRFMAAKHCMESGELGEGVMGYARLSGHDSRADRNARVGRELRSRMVPVPAYHGLRPLDSSTRSRSRSSPAAASACSPAWELTPGTRCRRAFSSSAASSPSRPAGSFPTATRRWSTPASRSTAPRAASSSSSSPASRYRAIATSIPSAAHAVTRYGKPFGFFYESIRHFADCVAEDKAPEATGEDGLIATAMIAATVRSLETGRPVAMDDVLEDF